MRYYTEIEEQINELIKELQAYYKVCTDKKQTKIVCSDYRNAFWK